MASAITYPAPQHRRRPALWQAGDQRMTAAAMEGGTAAAIHRRFRNTSRHDENTIKL